MTSPAADLAVAPAAACAHCGLPVATRRAPAAGERLFCCLGCRLASAAAAGDDGPRRFLEARLVFATFLAMGVMAGNLVLYGEDVYAKGDEPGLEVVRRLAQLGTAVFAVPVLLLLGVPMLRGAWSDLRRGAIRMDGLVVLATFAAFAVSVKHTFDGRGAVYYETATAVLVATTFGRLLEAHARTEARDAAAALADLLPATATLVRDGAALDVAPDALAAGDRVRVAPGAAFPADVRVVAGEGAYVAAHVTGESAPVAVRPGDEAPAGAANGASALEAVVVRPWRAGALGRIRDLLDAPVPLTKVVRGVDRLAGRLAVLAIALAVLGGAWSARRDGFGEGVRTALSTLLCACPCALGLATPLAYRAIRAALARRGVVVRDPSALENAVRPTHVVVDKTGTLTRPVAGRVLEAAPGAGRRLAELVRASGHALGAAFPREVDGAAAPAFADLRLIPGRGATALRDGVVVVAGDPAWVESLGATWSPELAAARRDAAGVAASQVAFAEDGRIVAHATIEHRLRPHAKDAVAALAARGATLEILSGDAATAVAAVARELGVPFLAGASPDEKAARVRTLRAAGGRVVAVGDGVNDAPLLRTADVGVAVGSGTAAARSEAGVELAGDDLRGLVALNDAARALATNVRGNLFWTLAYNGVALAAAAAGRLHPLIAVAAMTGSSLAVAFRAHRLLDWTPPAEAPPSLRPSARRESAAPRAPAGAAA